MDRRQIALALVLNELGLPRCIESFDDRLILQKALYLVQAKGLDLGYFFNWYLRGPYCRSLADDAFSMDIGAPDKDAAGWQLESGATGQLRELKPIFAAVDRRSLADRLELLASVHFLVARRQVPRQDAGEISAVLGRFNKDYAAKAVAEALEELTHHGLLPARG